MLMGDMSDTAILMKRILRSLERIEKELRDINRNLELKK